MLSNLGNNWIQKIPLSAKLGSAYGLVQFSSPQNFYHPIISQIGQFIVLLHIFITSKTFERKFDQHRIGTFAKGNLSFPNITYSDQ